MVSPSNPPEIQTNHLVYDLEVRKDVMGGASEESEPKKKKTPSDQIRQASIADYVHAHAKPNGNGWRGFFHSNLFVALALWLLSQAVLIVGALIAMYIRTGQLSDWRASVDATLKRHDEQGTIHSHYEIQRLEETTNKLERTVSKLELAEHERLVKEVEELKNGKK